MDSDEERSLFDQLQDEQTQAGLAHIASTASMFRQKLMAEGFDKDESYELTRDMLNVLMDAVQFAGQPLEDE